MQRLCKLIADQRIRNALVTAAITLVWFFTALHARPLVPILGLLNPDAMTVVVFAGVAALLFFRPKCWNGLYGIVLFWMLLLFVQRWSAGAESAVDARMFIPYGDNAGYSFEATRVVHGLPFTGYAAAHLISHSFFATLTFLTSYDMMALHLITAAIMALSICVFAMEVRTAFGAMAAAVCVAFCGQIIFGYLGSFASELYGFAMGLVGAASILYGIRKNALWWQLLGLFTIGVGLDARPGAFFVLPLAGFALATMQPTWKKRAPTLGYMAVAVIASLAFNVAATRLLSEPESTPMSMDIWHHLNGMLMGQTWNASVSCFTAQQAHDAVMKTIANNPWSVFEASWKAVSYFFASHTAFSFLNNEWLNRNLPWLYIASAAWCGIRFRNRLYRLVLFSFIGIVISIPFLPPWDAGIRTYTATLPFQLLGIAVPACLAADLVGRLFPRFVPHGEGADDGAHPGYGAAVVATMLAASTLVPFAMLHTPMHFGKTASWYYDGYMQVRLFPGNYLRIVPDGTAKSSYVPIVRRSDYLHRKESDTRFFNADYTAIYDRMPEGVIVTRSDAVGYVFIIKDVYGDKLPESVSIYCNMVQLRGDRVVYDKRLGIDQSQVDPLLDSFYLPWLTGYEYFFNFHPVLGLTMLVSSVPNGVVTLKTQNYGVLETSKATFPRFVSKADGATYLLDMEKKTLTKEPQTKP
jgi:hypothetical protein